MCWQMSARIFRNPDVIDLHIIKDVRDGTAEFIGTRGPTYGDRPSPNFAGIIDTQTDDKSAARFAEFSVAGLQNLQRAGGQRSRRHS